MKRIILILAICILFPLFGETKNPIYYTKGVDSCTGWNCKFLNDNNLVALYRFESGALTTDSKGTNTLTNVNTVSEDTTNELEGSCCADIETGSAQYFSRTDADLSSDFPLKSGDTTKKFTICGWFKKESTSAYTLFGKWDETTGAQKRSLLVYLTSSKVRMAIGIDGSTSEDLTHATALTTGVAYNVCCSFDNSTKAYAIRIRSTTGDTIGTDLTGTATNNIWVGAAPFGIGGILEDGVWGFYWDGIIDELVVFKDVLSEADTTKIATGAYK